MTLIYSANGAFPFKDELDHWQKQLSNLIINYIDTSKEGRLKTLNTKYIIPNTIYYLAGAPKMVDGFGKILLELKVDETNIRYDRFDGY